MRNLLKILAVAALLAFPSVAEAQFVGPYGPGPVPCGGVACSVTSLTVNGNAILTSPAAAQLQNGAADVAGVPVAQTESEQSAAGVSNQAGANTTWDLSAGTGTGVGGNLVINGAPHSTTNTTKNAYAAALTINGDTLAVTTGNNFTSGGNVIAAAAANFSWGGSRAIITSPLAAVVQIGNADAASPLAQTIQAQSVVAGNANTAGGTFAIAGSKSNGSGGGDMVFQTTLSNASSGVQNTLATALTLKGGTQAAVFSGVINAANLSTSSAGTTGTVCWTTGTGLFNVDTTTTCLLSLEELKDIRGPISGAEALSDVLALKPFWGSWKKSTPEYAGDKAEQPFLGAHQVASVDKRLAAYAPNGDLHGVRYQELTAVLVGAIKAQQDEIEALFAVILGLIIWNFWLTFVRLRRG